MEGDPQVCPCCQVSGSEEGRTGLASTTKTPAGTTPRPEDLRIKPPAALPRPRFLSSTVHGAFSLFAKERMGGAMHQLAS